MAAGPHFGKGAAGPGPARGWASVLRSWWVWPCLVYLAVNVPLILLTLDPFNVNGGNYSASFLVLGLNPYRMLSTPGLGSIVLSGAGYGILPYDYIGYSSYLGFGFSPLAASIVLKSLGALAGLLAAGIAYRLAIREGSPRARTVFTALLLNPFLIFVNAIWGETELFIVLLLVCAVYLLRYGQGRPTNYPALLLGSVALAMTAFAYFFTILLIPALLVYIEGSRQRITSFVVIAVVVAVFAIPFLIYGLTSNVSTSLGGAGAFGAYSFLNLLPASVASAASASQRIFIGLAGVLAVLIPLVFRRYGIGLGTTLLAVIWVTFSLTFFLPGDAFMILAALVVLAAALSSTGGFSYARILILQLFLVPLVLIVQMVNGPGQVSGILYWTYALHHQNTTLYQPLGGFRGLQVYLALYFAGGLAVVAYWVRHDWVAQHGPASDRAPDYRPKPLPNSSARPTSLVVVVLVALLLVAVPVALATGAPNPPALRLNNQFDPLDFYPYDVSSPSTYPLSASNTYSVAPQAGTLSIAGPSFPMGFARSTQSQTTILNFSASIGPGSGPGPVPVWQTNHTEVDLTAQPSLGADLPWNLSSTGGAPARSETTPVFSGSTSVYTLNQSQSLEYPVPASVFNGSNVYFGVDLARFAPSHTQLWWMVDGAREFQAFLAGDSLYVGQHTGPTWTYDNVVTGPGLASWFLTGFSIGAPTGALSTFVNGVDLPTPFIVSPLSNLTLYEGGPNPVLLSNSSGGAPDDVDGLVGNVTATYSLSASGMMVDTSVVVWTSALGSWVRVGNGTGVNITYSGAANSVSLKVDQDVFQVAASDGYVLLGKLGVSPGTADFAFYEISFGRAAPGENLALVVLGFAVLLPAWLIAWSTFELWRSRRAALKAAAQRPEYESVDQAK